VCIPVAFNLGFTNW